MARKTRMSILIVVNTLQLLPERVARADNYAGADMLALSAYDYI
jgi:hypothetical protein